MIFYSLAKTRRRKEIGYALGGFAPLREIIFFILSRDEKPLHQSTQPQGAGGVSMGLVRSNRTENSVADPSLLRL